MPKIHMTRQFIEGSGRQGDFFQKTKKPFLDKVNGSMCAEFQVYIVFRLARWRDTIHTFTCIQVKLGIFSTGCSPHVDFDTSRSTQKNFAPNTTKIQHLKVIGYFDTAHLFRPSLMCQMDDEIQHLNVLGYYNTGHLFCPPDGG